MVLRRAATLRAPRRAVLTGASRRAPSPRCPRFEGILRAPGAPRPGTLTLQLSGTA
jgi:hypothetical protein